MSFHTLVMAFGVAMSLIFSPALDAAPAQKAQPTPILVATFGTMSAAGRSAYENFALELGKAFPGHEIGWAFTAKSLVARLKAKGEKARLLSEAYADLKKRGFHEVALLSLHLVPGEQHQGVLAEDRQGLAVTVAGPLLATDADIDAVAQSMAAELPKDRPVLVVAHGHAHEAQYNAALVGLGKRLSACHPHLLMTRLEGDEAPQDLAAFITQAQAAGKVQVEPFLFVAGDHVQNDILGDEPDSLKSRLAVPDFVCAPALGARPWVYRHFIQQLKSAMGKP